MRFSRSSFVRVRGVRSVERITRQRGGARPVRSAIGRADWSRRTRRARRTRCRKILICAHGGLVACSVQRGLCNGPVMCFEGRVFSTEIEYARSRYLVLAEVDMDPFEGRGHSTEIFRSRFLDNGSEYPKAEYARRRSFDPGISDTDSEYPRAEYARRRSCDSGILDADSQYPRAEYARRRSCDPGMRIVESRVRSTETEYSRSRDLWSIAGKRIQSWSLGSDR